MGASDRASVQHDAVNAPRHYRSHPTGVECIEIIEHFPYNVGNAIKYLWRAGLKSDAIEDLRKAAWYSLREAHKRGWRETSGVGQEVRDTPPIEATALFFFLDAEGTLRVKPFDLMPMDRGELNPNAGAIILEGCAYARTEGCARTAGRNTHLYEETERGAFDLLASKLARWRGEMLQTGSYVQVQPSRKG